MYICSDRSSDLYDRRILLQRHYKKAGLEKKEEKVYQYQYDLIVDSPDSQFWQAVYASARKTAAQNDVLLEIMGPDREPPMTNWTT